MSNKEREIVGKVQFHFGAYMGMHELVKDGDGRVAGKVTRCRRSDGGDGYEVWCDVYDQEVFDSVASTMNIDLQPRED